MAQVIMLFIFSENHSYHTMQSCGSGEISVISFSIFFDLFKKDTEPKTTELKFLKFEDFEILFRRDDFFDTEFLIEQLQIPKENHELFYEYLDSKLMLSSFLEDSNRLDLIEKLYKYSKEYLVMSNGEEYDKE